MEKVQYYLDIEDQITVDGHTLSRLYLKEPLKEPNPLLDEEYAVYGYDHKGKVVRGGYIESLDSLPTVARYGEIAWVYEDSKVYGDTKITTTASIMRSTIVDSKIHGGAPWGTQIIDSTVRNSTIHSDCRGSLVENSHCTKAVFNSEIKNSEIKQNYVFDSKITDSQISAKNEKKIINANLTNVHHIGGLAGTFNDVEPGDIKMHPIYFANGKSHEANQLIIGPNNELALYNDIEDEYNDYETIIPAGDITKQELLAFLKQPTEKGTVGNAKSIEFVESLQTPEELEIDDIVSGLSELDNLTNDSLER